MRRTKLLLLFGFMLLLQACLKTSQLEEVAIINTRGIDIIEEGGEQIIEQTLIPYIFDPNTPESTNILIGQGKTIKEARNDAANQSSFNISPGKISIDFYGRKAAEAGLLPLLNTLIRDATVSDDMQLVITNQTAKEILVMEQQQVQINTTRYLQDMVKKEIKLDTFPRNTLEYFSRLVQQIGVDPILPIVDIVDELPSLVGAAAFQKDRYVGSLSLEEAYYINQLRKTTKETPIEAVIPLEKYQEDIPYKGDAVENEENIYIYLTVNKGKGKIKIENVDNLSFKGEIKLHLILSETSVPMDVGGKSILTKIENDLEAFFKEEYDKLFAKLQEMESDAFGLGRTYITTRKGSKTTDKEWRKKYQDATMKFDIDVQIINYGTID